MKNPAISPRVLAMISPRKLDMIWEVYARLKLRPTQAVHLLRRQGLFFTPVQASQQMAEARRRNTLRLVFPRSH